MILSQFSNNESTYGYDYQTEKPLRSIMKSVSWRIIGTLDTIVISWLVTGTLKLALSIGAIELITKMTLYFFHERVWNMVKWGR